VNKRGQVVQKKEHEMSTGKKVRRIAVPVKDGKLCIHFGQSQLFYLYEVCGGELQEKKEVVPPGHAPEVYPRWLAELGVTDVITGGIGRKAIDVFLEERINVFDGAPVKDAGELVEDFLKGKLENLGNYCDH
jgi:predicted Fe-Mo cluster-binding NifX family protein